MNLLCDKPAIHASTAFDAAAQILLIVMQEGRAC